jgi:hypothetical protein
MNRLALYGLVFSLMVSFQNCIGLSSPQDLIERNDHAGLVTYYTEEARKFKQTAQEWERKAEFYETRYRRSPSNPNPHEPLAFERHAAHCRMIAQSNWKAAEEAEALVDEHRKQLQPPK